VIDPSLSADAWRRIAAFAVDWLIISAYAAALVPLGLLLLAGTGGLAPEAGNALGFGVLVLPATVWLAAWERSAHGASTGKRTLRLWVRAPDQRSLGWSGALIRNGLKIALPWELGHTAAFTLADANAAPISVAVGLSCGIAACAIALVYIATLFTRTGRTPYDLAAGSVVSARSARLEARRLSTSFDAVSSVTVRDLSPSARAIRRSSASRCSGSSSSRR
jgi:uncharacterized RDD family membrane protein YckC